MGNAIGNQYHPECFVCDYCGCSFAGGTFFESGGKPFCSAHYHQQTGATCGGCGKAITGKSASAGDKKYHPECLTCAFCLHPLGNTPFSSKNNKNYCRTCFSKLFSK